MGRLWWASMGSICIQHFLHDTETQLEKLQQCEEFQESFTAGS